MSLSRPARFPLLKLPFLCIECILKNCEVLDIILFTLISKRTLQIVKHLKISLNGIGIFLLNPKGIELGNPLRKWYFKNESRSGFDGHQNLKKYPLVPQENADPLYISKTDYGLVSYTDGNEITALKMAMDFLNEMFKCSVERVEIINDNYPESGDIGVKSTVHLSIDRHFGYARSQELNLLLEKLEVTGTLKFWMNSTEKGFYVDPKLFKCKKLVFYSGSAAWVTREILLQFEVPQLSFLGCPFFVEDIEAFVTQWFRSDNNKLEHLHIVFRNGQISLKDFRMAELNPMSFSERNRVPLAESFKNIDFSKGLEIVRHDGLQATIHVGRENFMFYIWHKQGLRCI